MTVSVRHWGLGLAVAGVFAAAAMGGDWPQWGGRGERNMVSAETGLAATFDPGRPTVRGQLDANSLRNVRWVARLGSQAFGNPTVSRGKVYVGTNDRYWRDGRVKRSRGGLLLCLDERTGRTLWRLLVPRLREKVYGSAFDDMNLGICSSPTVAGGRVYVVTNRAEVLCLDPAGLANGNDGPFREEGRYLAGAGGEPVALGRGDADIVWRFDMIGRRQEPPACRSGVPVLQPRAGVPFTW